MKPVYTILISLVALAGGGIGGYLLGGHSAGPRPQVTQDPGEPETRPATEATPLSPKTPKASSAETDNEPPQQRTAPPGGANAFDAWIALFADSVPAPGNGRIHGKVVQKDGTALAGVTVTVTPQRSPSGNRYPSSDSIQDTLENYARWVHFSRSGRREAVTGDDGLYEINGLGDYKYSIGATAEGFQIHMDGGYYGGVTPDCEVNFSAQPMCLIKLDVRKPDGTQPDEASVTLRKGSGSETSYWQPNHTTLQFNEGAYTLEVSVGEDQSLVSEPFPIELKIGNPPLERTIHLKPNLGISCEVSFPAVYSAGQRGFSFYSVRVILQPDPPPGPPTSVIGRESDSRHRGRGSAHTFSALKPGPYRLLAVVDGEILVWKDVTLADQFLKEALEVPEPVAADYIVMRVFAPDGTPIRDANVNVGAPGLRHRDFNVLRPEDGSFWLRRVKPEAPGARDNKEWSYSISIRTESYGQHNEVYPGNGTHVLEVRLPAPCFVTILIPGATAHPAKARLSGQLWLKRGNSNSGVQPKDGRMRGGLDSDKLEYGPLAPGSYRFVLSASGGDERGRWDRRELADWNFELIAGEITQTCPIPQLCTLTLLIPDTSAVRGISLRRENATLGSINVRSDEIKDRTVIEFLTPGEWILRTSDGEMRVPLSGDREVRLDVQRFNCLRLSLRENGGIHELGLRNGDLLVAVDAQEFETTGDLHKQAMFSYTLESTTWTVQRNGATVNVSFNGREAQKIMEDRSGERDYIGLSPAVRE